MRNILGMIPLLVPGLRCAGGPHPALEVASKTFDCPSKELTRHEIYPEKQRIEGCGKEAVFVHGCDGYGATSECAWVKLKQ